MKGRLRLFYKILYKHFGPQHWWPAQSPLEVMVGSILTQNTNWSNVEKAIAGLKRHKLLEFEKLYKLPEKKLAVLIRPAGYYNIKSRRLKHLLVFLADSYNRDIKRMSRVPIGTLRRQLLGVNGIGPETADSILLYALNKPVFVVDSYTKRIFARQKFIRESADYEDVQNFFMHNLKKDVRLFNEFHALIVRLGKDYCLKSNPKCGICPVRASCSLRSTFAKAR